MSASVTGMELYGNDGKQIVPVNSMFLASAYCHFNWDFQKVSVLDSRAEVLNKLVGYGEFYIELEKVSSTEFKVSLNRVHQDPRKIPDCGCFLEVIITVVGHRGPPKRKFMDSRTDSVYDVYGYDDIGVHIRKSKMWTVLCVVYMHEVSVLCNEATKMQNKLIKDLEKQEKYRRKLGDMAFLLKRESLNDLFSGRQDYEFALLKAGFIERTLIFADQIAKKIKAGDIKYQTQTLPDVYLGYIFKSDFRPIDKKELLDLYTFAQHLGLSYLVDECRDLMLGNLDPEFLVNVLEHSVGTFDIKLTRKAFASFLRNRDRVTETEAWKNLLSKKFNIALCILYIAQQRMSNFLSRAMAQWEAIYEEQLPDMHALDVSYHMEKLSQKNFSEMESSTEEQSGKSEECMERSSTEDREVQAQKNVENIESMDLN